ncbi:hypothetical protein [Flavobacterium branchiophilum]|uniref:hypothetical protein n=1 Tax=Flavobacterium branchiophilum TaxID=55197 RepID=UPI00117B9200|nr:hypothetical protein [Flavobacterium branchiophilum]
MSGLRKDIKYILCIALIIVISTELCLNKINAIFFKYQYEIGLILLKLSFSYISSFIFYYIVVYLPKKRKRIKTYRFLNNQIMRIKYHVLDIIYHLNKDGIIDKEKDFIEEDIELLCKNINPKNEFKIISHYTITFNNYYDFQNYKTSKIKEIIRELFYFHDVIDDKLLYFLTNINDVINQNYFSIEPIDIPYNPNIEFLSRYLFELYLYSNDMVNYFINEFSRNYGYEYHYNERKQYSKRNELSKK